MLLCLYISFLQWLFVKRGERKIKKREMEGNFFFRDIINKKKWANTAETIKMISKAKESRGVVVAYIKLGMIEKINWVVTRIYYDGNKLSRCKQLQYVATLDPFFLIYYLTNIHPLSTIIISFSLLVMVWWDWVKFGFNVVTFIPLLHISLYLSLMSFKHESFSNIKIDI